MLFVTTIVDTSNIWHNLSPFIMVKGEILRMMAECHWLTAIDRVVSMKLEARLL